MSERAVCLLSGGMDSAVCLALARSQGYECFALSFDYGQRHRYELEAARRVAQACAAREHRIVSVGLASFGGSALTDSGIAVPKRDSVGQVEPGIPVTYVPARNTVFLSIALGWAEVLGAAHLFAGMNAIDYSGYPDCRPEYIAAFEQMANLATKAAVEGTLRIRIHTPLIRLSKAGIIKLAVQLGVDLSLTSSCYDPGERGQPCGACDSCLLRQKGFKEAGLADPLRYPQRNDATRNNTP